MTTLATPPTWLQFSGPGAGNNSCGAHAVASSLVGGVLLPMDTALAQVEAVVGLGETSVQQLVDALHHFGATGATAGAGAAVTLAAGRYVIPLIQSDGMGCPVRLGSTEIDHWVCQYGDDPVRIANSGSGLDETYDPGAWAGYTAGVTIDSGCTPPAPEDNEMTLDMARLQVWPWYVNWCGRVAKQEEIDYWAARLASGKENYELIVTEFYNSDEAVAYRAAQAAKQ